MEIDRLRRQALRRKMNEAARNKSENRKKRNLE
jgi:hypothetical protein